MLVQLTAQAFYYLTGTLFLLLILHKGLFSKIIPENTACGLHSVSSQWTHLDLNLS